MVKLGRITVVSPVDKGSFVSSTVDFTIVTVNKLVFTVDFERITVDLGRIIVDSGRITVVSPLTGEGYGNYCQKSSAMRIVLVAK